MNINDFEIIQATQVESTDIESGTDYRYVSCNGRADERLSAKIYQHYGFKSAAPKNTERLTIVYGNNTVSVAENDIDVITKQLQNGEVILYTGDQNSIDLLPNNTIEFKTKSLSVTTNAMTVQSNPINTTYYLVTEQFLTSFLSHTHVILNPASPLSTLTPNYLVPNPAGPTPLFIPVPFTLADLQPSLSTTLKAD